MKNISILLLFALVPFFAHSQCSVTISATNVSCNGASNGIMIANPTGTGPYTYLWTPGGQTTQTVFGVNVGTYTVTVTDANFCVSTATVAITQPTALYTIVMNSTDASCTCNGTVDLLVGGGSPPYSYSWSPAGGNGPNATGLCAGQYTCTIVDQNGCITAGVQTINQTAPLSISPTQTSPSCFGGCNGSATANVSGGAPGYTYSWSPSGGNAATATGLCAGTYVCTVSDVHGCTASTFYGIGQPSQLSSVTSFTNQTCSNTCDGSISLSMFGGTPPYSYSWSPSVGNTATVTGLCAGSYTCTVVDANGCANSFSATVTQPSALVSTHNQWDALCFGTCTGSATVIATGGTPGYTYLWTPSSNTSATESNLCVGGYTCTIADANGCTTTETMIITEPTPISVSISTQPASCSSCCDGISMATANGGTPAYTVMWSTGGTFFTESNLCTGTYTCCVTDMNGCMTCDTSIVNFITGIPEASSQEILSVFPNPANESITISQPFSAPTSAVMTITNVLGEVVFSYLQAAQTELNLNIDLSAFESGMYILTVATNSGTSTERFVKQ